MMSELPPVPPDMRRVMVLGPSGSGKSTLAQALADVLDGRYVDFTYHKHDDAWQMRPPAEFRAIIDRETQAERWTTDHNGGEVRELVWPRADTAVVLDYPRWIVFWRLTKRSLLRAVRRERLYGTDKREAFFKHLRPSRSSKYYKSLANFRSRRDRILTLTRSAEYSHLRVVHLTHPRQADQWLAQVQVAYAPSVDSR